MAAIWYYAKNGSRCGPIDTTTLRLLADSQQITPTDLLWREGLKEWVPASQVEGLFATSAATIPPPLPKGLSPRDRLPTFQAKSPQVEEKKSKRIPTYVWIIVGAVVILLAIPMACILSAIIIPKPVSTSPDALVSSTQTTLSTVRMQIELYKLQHNDRFYPALTASTDGNTAWNVLISRSDITGATGTDATSYPFGPYFTVPPSNALNQQSGIVIADIHSSTPKTTPNAGWVWDSTNFRIKAIVPADWPAGKIPYAPGGKTLDTKYAGDFTK